MAWLAANAALSTLAILLRVSWRSVAAIVVRVVRGAGRAHRPARRVAPDRDREISYWTGQRYLLCVVDHDTGRLVWAGKDRNAATLGKFFDLLGPARSAQLSHVSADGAEWIHEVVAEHAPQVVLCLDAVHVLAWASAALDAVRRGMCNQLRSAGKAHEAAELKGTRWALLRNAANQTGDQRTTVAAIATTNTPLYRAYLLTEQLRMVFETQGEQGRALLAWAQRSQLPEFVKLADPQHPRPRPEQHPCPRPRTPTYGCSPAAPTATTAPDVLIAVATLTCGGCCPELPGRS